ncbi:MAG: DMT family transporter [Halanaerobiales bacterium]|nr:DMT family transporter [Halanaerobiales bacterium]
MKLRFPPYLALVFGVIAVSFAAIFIRLADAPAPVIAFYRMGIATLILSPFVLFRYGKELKKLTSKQIFFCILSGLFLALHFFFWITSFDHTSVASSVVFVTTQPIFVAIAGRFILKERPGLFLLCGIALSCVGSLIIGAGDLSLSSTHLYGDLMALIGSVMAAGYLLSGRYLRQSMSLGIYIFMVYGICSIFLLIYILSYGISLVGFDNLTWFSMFMLALVPTLVGHTSFNWALKYLQASVVSASMLVEPVVATLLAWVILKETPPVFTLIGGILILVGLYLTTLNSDKFDDAIEEKIYIEG